jgi:hypothetical protein
MKRWLIPALTLLLTACPYDDQLKQLNDSLKQTEKDLNQQISETRKTFAEVSQGAIKAVPGERYLEIIDDLNGPDAEKKKRAQDFLKSLAHVDLSVEYEATIWFQNIPPNERLEVWIFRAQTPDFGEIQVRLNSKNYNLVTVNGPRNG